MRNVAFSILLGALALLQVAVVAAELSHIDARVAAAPSREDAARYVLAESESAHETAKF